MWFLLGFHMYGQFLFYLPFFFQGCKSFNVNFLFLIYSFLITILLAIIVSDILIMNVQVLLFSCHLLGGWKNHMVGFSTLKHFILQEYLIMCFPPHPTCSGACCSVSLQLFDESKITHSKI